MADSTASTLTVTLKGPFTTAQDGQGLVPAPPTNSPGLTPDDINIILGNSTSNTTAETGTQSYHVSLAVLLGIVVPFVVFSSVLCLGIFRVHFTIKRWKRLNEATRRRLDPGRIRAPAVPLVGPAAPPSGSGERPGGTVTPLVTLLPPGDSASSSAPQPARPPAQMQRRGTLNGASLAIVFLVDCSGSMAHNHQIDTAQGVLNELLIELQSRDPQTAVAVITHGRADDGAARLDTVVQLATLCSLDGSHFQGSQFHADGSEAYEEALTEASNILRRHAARPSIAGRLIVMIGDGDVKPGRHIDLERLCRQLADDNIPAHSILLGHYGLDWSMQKISRKTGGRSMDYTSAMDVVDAIIPGALQP